MRKMLGLILVLGITLGFIPAGAAQEPIPEYELYDYETPFLWQENSETILALQQECSQPGTVETIEYTAPAYAINEVLGRDEQVNKAVCVYLPYGYDESQQYDVLYLLHGTGGDNEYWLTKQKTGIPTKNVLDNMIAQGLCKPLIVVAPDWNADLKGKKNKIEDEAAIAYAEKIGEPNISKRNDLWCLFFDQELVNDIIPLVEGQYSTYACGDTSYDNLIVTRDHRALVGLSRGSTTTLRGMISHSDIFSWFGCFSGAWVREDNFVESMRTSFDAGRPILYWYNGNGTADFSLGNHAAFVNNARETLSDLFVEGENMAFIVKEGSAHTYENWITDLYNVLIVFFAE